MKIIKIQLSYDITFEASNLSPAELAQLMILITKCQIYRMTSEKVGKDYVYASYTKDIELTMSRENVIIHADYEAAKAHLEMLQLQADHEDTSRVTALADADAAALLMSEPEKV
jgi:phage gp45-like